MKKLLILFIFVSYANSNNIHIWTKKEDPSLQNNYDNNKYVYETNNICEAISVTLFETLLNKNNITKNKEKPNTNFKDIKEFENSMSNK